MNFITLPQCVFALLTATVLAHNGLEWLVLLFILIYGCFAWNRGEIP